MRGARRTDPRQGIQLSWVSLHGEPGPRPSDLVGPGRSTPDPTPVRPTPVPSPVRSTPGPSPVSELPRPRLLIQPVRRPRERRWGPILPFWGVLLRGFDGPVRSNPDDAPDVYDAPTRPTYHPSVGYAREIYVAIGMNWLVDLLGFVYLFHSYLVGWEPLSAWLIATLLSVAFSTAFATFAVSLVRKPLSAPRRDTTVLAVAGGLVAVGVLGLVAGSVWDPTASPLARFVSVVSWLPLGAGGLAALASTFGFQDGVMVFTRATVMSGVAYLVAGPLHEAMFEKEIERSFRDLSLEAIAAEGSTLRPELEQARSAVFGACMRSRSAPEEGACRQPKAERERAELLVQTIAFVEQQELTGVDGAASRAFLLDRAREVGGTAVVALLGGGATGRAGIGPRYQQAVAMKAEALRSASAAKQAEDACVSAVASCEGIVAADPRVQGLERRLASLQTQADAVQSGVERPGAIERALALESIVRGHGNEGGRRAAILNGKLLAAWFLAMVMPVLVLVMKCSAGDKLEPYLRKRWTGRVVP